METSTESSGAWDYVAVAPLRSTWNGIRESSSNLFSQSSESDLKIWSLFVVFFLVFCLTLAIAWFIVVKATHVTVAITFLIFTFTFGASSS